MGHNRLKDHLPRLGLGANDMCIICSIEYILKCFSSSLNIKLQNGKKKIIFSASLPNSTKRVSGSYFTIWRGKFFLSNKNTNRFLCILSISVNHPLNFMTIQRYYTHSHNIKSVTSDYNINKHYSGFIFYRLLHSL